MAAARAVSDQHAVSDLAYAAWERERTTYLSVVVQRVAQDQCFRAGLALEAALVIHL